MSNAWLSGLLRSLAVLTAAAAGFGGVAAAQSMSCTTNPTTPTLVRSGGVAELAGDVVVSCTGGTPVTTGAYPTVSVSMFFNTAVTSRILASPFTEAVVIIDNPAPGEQVPCTASPCASGDNVIQGRLDSFNSLVWPSIPLNPPGPNATRTLRFKNLRINTNNLPSSLSAFVFLSLTGTQVGTFSNPQQTIANAAVGTTLEVRGPTDQPLSAPLSYVACTGNNVALAASNAAGYSTPGGRSFLLRFGEAAPFTGGFRKRSAGTTVANPQAVAAQDVLAVNYNTESGFYNPAFPAVQGLDRLGLADSGTVLRAVFSNVPANARIFVSTREVTAGSSLLPDGSPSTKARMTANPGQPFVAATPDTTAAEGGMKEVPASGEVTWEVLETDPGSIESVAFAVAVSFSGSPQPTAGAVTVAGTLGPISAAATATAGDPLPRFSGAPAPVSAFVINACRTTLLFQFLTNKAGFDTGISISNTSRDTLNTTPQSGRCTATFFPSPYNATTAALFPPLAGPVLAGGDQWTFAVSNDRPGFQGYMMATCEFQFAHGFAFISDFGSTKLAQGYQALVLPDRPRLADPMSTAGAGSGEQLVH